MGAGDFRIYYRLLRQARPYWLHVAGVVALGMLATPLSLLTPLPLKIAVDSVIGSHPPPAFVKWLLPGQTSASAASLLAMAAALLIVTTLLLYVQALSAWILQTYVGEKLVLDFRAELFRHVQRLSISYHDARGTADSIYRIQYDGPCIQNVIITGGMPLFTATATLIGMVAITFSIDWQLALISLAVCPVLFGLTRFFAPRLRQQWREIKKYESSAMGVVQEALGSVRVVKAFGREPYEHDRFKRRSEERLRGQVRVAYVQGRFDLLVGMTIAAGTAATLAVGVLHVRAGALTIGNLLVVMAYLAQIYEPLKTISKKLGDVQNGLASADRAFALLDELPEVIEKPHSRPLSRASRRVAFHDVSFAYPDGPRVLHNVSFTVAPGTRVGIAGRTGAGKTTLVSLLMRFYDPSEGQILLDGVDLREYCLADLRNQFSLVLQDTVLFSTTIAENILYASPAATEDEIVRAAKAANAHEFIMSLPDGYRTEVGERGMRLSGGERQRISLARAFLKDAPILILDEPTSSIDVKTEAGIMDAMGRLMRGRTTFMIAHRLSTLDNCDLRLEVEAGRVTVRPAVESAKSLPEALLGTGLE
jgi:ATP-binding cassette subfamily B protein